MIRERTETCASCTEFPIREAAQNGGAARCAIYERMQEYHDRACVLYTRDKANLESRRRLALQINESLKEKPNE